MDAGPSLPFRPVVLAYAFLSGFCGLTYQVVWERGLKTVFGGDVVSAAVIVSVFLLGLGIGGFLFRTVRRNAWLVLAGIELLIGLFGIASYALLHEVEGLATAEIIGTGAGASLAAGALGSALFLGVPTLLMGGTLPLMLESFVPKAGRNTSLIGAVYGANVFGGFAGAVLPTLVFGTWGFPAVLRATAMVNMALGVALLALQALRGRNRAVAASFARDEHPSVPEAPLATIDSRSPARVLPLFAFLSGFVALSLEILFVRFIGLLQGHSAYSFPIILSAYLLSMALGSFVWTSLAGRPVFRRVERLPYVLQAALGSVLPLTLILIEPLLRGEDAVYFEFGRMFDLFVSWIEQGRFLKAALLAGQFSLPLFVLVVPAVFVSGGIFPLLVKRLSGPGHTLGRASGILYLWNSVGCAAGALATAFVLIPAAGWYGALATVAAVSVAAGAVGILDAGSPTFPARTDRTARRRLRPAAAAAFAIASVVLFLAADRDIKYKIASGTYAPAAGREAYREGTTGVACARRKRIDRGTVIDIYSDGVLMSELPSAKFAYIACLPRFQEKLESVLVLGLGGGQNVSDLLADPRVRRVVVVDWSREIIDLAGSRPISLYNGNPLADPRVRVIKNDARLAVRLLHREAARFDAVVNNLCFPRWSGAGAVTSAQFFRSVREILAPDGYYYHVANVQHWREWDQVLGTLAFVFDRVAAHNDRILVCGARPFSPLAARIASVLSPELRRRTDPYLVSSEVAPEGIEEAFRARIRPVPESDRPGSAPLTDETPAAEYPVSWTLLWERFVSGSKAARVSQP